MIYIKTKDGIYEYVGYDDECIIPSPIIKYKDKLTHCLECDIIKKADTIEELFDELVGIRKSNHKAYTGRLDGAYWFAETNGWLGRIEDYEIIYGAIYTDSGLIYKAKMKRTMPNSEIHWELLEK